MLYISDILFYIMKVVSYKFNTWRCWKKIICVHL